MLFTKMQGTGNDFVIVNQIEESVDIQPNVKWICDRHYGIGADGLIVLESSKAADVRMRIFNSDGSEAEMCGNGIRCVGKYLFEKNIRKKFHLCVETNAGRKEISLGVHEERVETVTVDMGKPILYPREIPAVFPGRDVIMQQLILLDESVYPVTCVSMGNPHAVIFVEDPDDIDIEKVGAQIEKDPHFPLRTNVEFARCEDRRNIRMRVWERGVGETHACGTGACAVVVAAILNHLTDDEVSVKLKGGNLFIQWDRWKEKVLLTGTAETVFEGKLEKIQGKVQEDVQSK